MAPKKKTPTMVWVRKSQQSVDMAKPATEMKTSLLPYSVSKLHPPPSPSPSAKMATKEQTLSVPDWSFLPEELLHIISKKLEDCFDVVHARSVCTLWRSIFPFPSCLLRTRYFLPTLKYKGMWTLEKIPLFLFRVRVLATESASEYFLGGIGRDESDELSSSIQCSVKVEIPGSDPTVLNIHDSQILPLGHQYRMIGCNAKDYRGVAFLPLNKEGREGGEFVVMVNYTKVLLVLRSAEMRWMRLPNISTATCDDLFTFRGTFYAVFISGDVFSFDPYSLEATPLMPLELLNCGSLNSLVPSGDDELFLVEKIIPRNDDVLDFTRLTLRVCRLDVEAGQWVVVTDIGDRVLFIGQQGNVSCSAKEFPEGCGVSGNSILFTYESWDVTYSYKYGVHTGREEDDLNCWRYSRENPVKILSTSPVVALRVERCI